MALHRNLGYRIKAELELDDEENMDGFNLSTANTCRNRHVVIKMDSSRYCRTRPRPESIADSISMFLFSVFVLR